MTVRDRINTFAERWVEPGFGARIKETQSNLSLWSANNAIPVLHPKYSVWKLLCLEPNKVPQTKIRKVSAFTFDRCQTHRMSWCVEQGKKNISFQSKKITPRSIFEGQSWLHLQDNLQKPFVCGWINGQGQPGPLKRHLYFIAISALTLLQ